MAVWREQRLLSRYWNVPCALLRDESVCWGHSAGRKPIHRHCHATAAPEGQSMLSLASQCTLPAKKIEQANDNLSACTYIGTSAFTTIQIWQQWTVLVAALLQTIVVPILNGVIYFDDPFEWTITNNQTGASAIMFVNDDEEVGQVP